MRGALLVIAALCAFGPLARADEGEAKTLEWQGVERSYLLYAPREEMTKPLPLVLAFHGAGGNAREFAAETRLAAPALAHGMMVAFADGTERAPGRRVWNAQAPVAGLLGRAPHGLGRRQRDAGGALSIA